MFGVFKSQIKKEENFLSKEFGQDYQQYIKEVPQLIPFVWI
jgi:protein-S-isoprenylcysteine O-methyltransferase Ste14